MTRTLTADYLDERLKQYTQDIISHFNRSQYKQDVRVDARFDKMEARFDEVEAKLEAIIEMGVTKDELRSLIRELNAHGIPIDERKVIASSKRLS